MRNFFQNRSWKKIKNRVTAIKWKKIMSSFQVQVLLSYLPLMLIFVIWTRVYLSIDHQRDELTEKLQKLENLENRFLENNSHLESFLLRGYRNPEFYKKASEPNINRFLSTQLQLQNSIRKLKFEFAAEGLDIEPEIDSIFKLNTNFIRSTEYLKALMYERGYLQNGLEGKLRKLGRMLEDSSRIDEAVVWRLRNLEKEFLRTSEMSAAKDLNQLVSAILVSRRLSEKGRNILVQYRSNFVDLVELERKIGIKEMSGAYAQVQLEMLQLRNFYEHIVTSTTQRSEILYAKFRRQLWLVSIIMIAILLAVSIYLSKDLTHDIRTLNKKMFSFIRSEFQSYKYQKFKPRNTEIANLNRSFDELITQLRDTLERMGQEKKRAEKTAEYKSLFLANMSHEIRTPLNGVIGMLHMLQGTRLNQKQKQYMDVVEYSANHLLDLVNMILDHSKMDAKKMRLEEIEFDLAGDMAKLIKIFEFKSQEKGLTIDLEIEGDFSQMLIGDSLRLQQVLINLLNNAIKFTEEGKICLRIVEEEKGKDYQRVKFVVKDSGIGISEADQRRLFDAFEQLDGSTTRQYGGTGLGLAISNQLVQLMGGQIKLESRLGEGAKFCFTLDMKLGSGKVSRKVSVRQTTQRKTNGASIRVLLAEDNPVNQKVLTLMLEKNGARVQIANNGLEAVKLFRAKTFDIVLMDLQMPEMDGLEALAEIKKLDLYKKRPVPIIAVTANAFSEDRRKALAAGMDDFLTKPIRPQEFKGILAKYTPDLLVE